MREPQLTRETLTDKLHQVQRSLIQHCLANLKTKEVFRSTSCVLSMFALQRLVLNHGQSMPVEILSEIVRSVEETMSSESILKGYHTASLGLIATMRLLVESVNNQSPETNQLRHQISRLLSLLVSRMAESPLSYLTSKRTIRMLGLAALSDGQLPLALYLAQILYLSDSPVEDEKQRVVVIADSYLKLAEHIKSMSLVHTGTVDQPKEIYDEDDYDDGQSPYQTHRDWEPEIDKKQILDIIVNSSKLLDWTDPNYTDFFQTIREYLSRARQSPEGTAAARSVLQSIPDSSRLLRVHQLQRDMYRTEYIQAYRIKR